MMQKIGSKIVAFDTQKESLGCGAHQTSTNSFVRTSFFYPLTRINYYYYSNTTAVWLVLYCIQLSHLQSKLYSGFILGFQRDTLQRIKVGIETNIHLNSVMMQESFYRYVG